MMRYVFTAFVAALVGTVSLGNPAMASDARVAGAKLCTAYIPTYERQYGIPSHLLSAISSTESGRYHDGLKIVLPWPWTINVEGKGYYFESKQEAVAAVKQHQAAGRRSIDIGCMQVNLIHHPNAFPSIEHAFDPKHNIEYAASFLRRLYEEEKSWRKAAAGYHSRTPERGSQYVSRVFRSWETIVNRLRLPKSNTIQQADASYDGRDMMPDAHPRASKPVQLSRSVQTASAKPVRDPMRMKVIKVSDMAADRQSDIIMIRPDVAQVSAEKAMRASPASITRVDEAPAPAITPTNARVVRMDGSAPREVKIASAAQPQAQKTGPRFIFTD